MNIDCLESCLEHLNIEELVNAASSNKRLYHAARYVFVKMYRHRVYIISFVKNCIDNRIYLKRNKKMNRLRILDLRMCLQFLRCFGDLISEMGLTLVSELCEWKHLIIEYINEYCSESLIKIEFYNNPKGGLNKLTKIFNKVEKITMYDSYPTEKKLNEIFPNIRKLQLYYGKKYDYEFIACNFPYLEHLDISETNLNDIQKKNLLIALRSNSQLKSLKAEEWFSDILYTNYFQETNEILQNIETLDVYIDKKIDYNSTISNKHLKNLKYLEISGDEFELYYGHHSSIFPFTSDQLESLTIRCEDYYNEFLFNIIEKFPNVKKLDIFWLDPMDFSKILKKMPLLEEIVCNCRMTADEIQSLRSLACWSVLTERVIYMINDYIIPENEAPIKYLCTLKRQI